MSDEYRRYQKQHAAIYRGDYVTDSSHGFSKKEMVDLGISCDHPTNYRNCNQFTNRSVHNRIDNLFMQESSEPLGGVNYRYRGAEHYISPQEMTDRLQWKIDVAKESGAMDQERVFNYLYGNAERLNMDLRTFNGW